MVPNTGKRRSPLTLLFILLAAFALIAAACGDSDDGASEEGGGTTTEDDGGADDDDGTAEDEDEAMAEDEDEAMAEDEDEAMAEDEDEAMAEDEDEAMAEEEEDDGDDGDDGGESGSIVSDEFAGTEITVAVVNNGATGEIQQFTPDFFEEPSGMTVNFLELPEQELRERVTLAAGTGSAEFDAFMIGPFEAPQFGGVNGWIQDLTPLAEADADYNLDDILDPIRGCLLYTSPSPRDATLSRMPSSA